MILDITLKGNTYLLKIHKKFFQNKSTPLVLFQANNPLTQKYSYLGLFHIDGEGFGFDACFKNRKEESEYFVYTFTFLDSVDRIAVRKMLLTLYLATYYVVEQMFYSKEYFSDTIWEDQALSFVIFNGGESRDGYPIGGQLYPWFKKRLYSLSDEELVNLNNYVTSELKRIYNYFFKKELFYIQITINRESFFIQVNMGGRWVAWTRKSYADKPEEFDSHNIDFCSDQELCFAAIIAMNTWLREN